MAQLSKRQFRQGRVLREKGSWEAILLTSKNGMPSIWTTLRRKYEPNTGTWGPWLHYNLSNSNLAHHNEWDYGVNTMAPNFDGASAYKAIDNLLKSVAPHNSQYQPLTYWKQRFAKFAPTAGTPLGTPPITPAAPTFQSSNTLVGMAKAGYPEAVAAAEDDDEATVPHVSRHFSVPTRNANPYWYESDEERKFMEDFISLHGAGFTVNLLIAGPSGEGKTVGVQQLGNRLGIPVHIVNCQAITTPEKWIGQVHADPVKGTYFEPSQHIQWVERTHPDCQGHDQCIILYDEITRLRAELNNMTYSLFDTQRGLEVPQMGRRVVMAPENIIIATANIGAAFTGTHTQDRAFRERFPLTLERTSPPTTESIKILTSATGIETEQARLLVSVAEASRGMWKQEEVESPISTRTLVNWALLVAGGYTIKKAAEYTVMPLYSEDGGAASDRARISAAIEGRVK